MRKHQYPEAVKREALAHIVAGESAYAVAKAMAIPETTVQTWRRELALVVAPVSKELVVTAGVRWAAVQEQATTLLTGNLQRYNDRGTDLEPHELKDVAVVAGIASDKFLDHTQGRKGMTINANIDNRTQTVVLSDDELRDATRHVLGRPE